MIEVIWSIVVFACVLLFVAFTFVIAFGAPFLPTLKKRVPEALDLINLRPGQTLLELGSGDGRVLKAAAERGIKAVGYELNPLLVAYSKCITYKHRHMVSVVWGDYWKKQWPNADGIFVFLLQPYMKKLDTKVMQNYPKGIKLVSFAFTIPNRKISKQKNGLLLYKYEAGLKNKQF